jgi:nicotinamidase-related amidase
MPSSTAVLVVDVQLGLIAGESPVFDGPALIGRIRSLTDRARVAGVPVVYIQDKDVGPPDSEAWQLHPGLDVQPADLRIHKAYADSFYQTPLHDELRARGVSRVVVVGCKTDACIDMTCRRAVSLGYDVVLVGDGHATSDNSFMNAQQSIAYYNIVLDGFGAEDGFGAGVILPWHGPV